jgi:hypothetical protein
MRHNYGVHERLCQVGGTEVLSHMCAELLTRAHGVMNSGGQIGCDLGNHTVSYCGCEDRLLAEPLSSLLLATGAGNIK